MDHTISEIILSSNFSDIDMEFVVKEIQGTYWANNRSREMILLSISHSLCYSAFIKGNQVGFMRVITDYATFAYLCDVVVEKKSRGKGIGQKMLKEVLANPELKNVMWTLRTKDAHSLYEKFGFSRTVRPERYMEM
ncbi:MAG: GNAT family N-acetyltransferase [Bdellovibrionales bacterium]|nr:GNAT family N-acetyltransferase [Bdellovibrionales bacterium]